MKTVQLIAKKTSSKNASISMIRIEIETTVKVNGKDKSQWVFLDNMFLSGTNASHVTLHNAMIAKKGKKLPKLIINNFNSVVNSDKGFSIKGVELAEVEQRFVKKSNASKNSRNVPNVGYMELAVIGKKNAELGIGTLFLKENRAIHCFISNVLTSNNDAKSLISLRIAKHVPATKQVESTDFTY